MQVLPTYGARPSKRESAQTGKPPVSAFAGHRVIAAPPIR